MYQRTEPVNFISKMYLLPILVLSLLEWTSAANTILDACKYKVEPLGCFADDVMKRAVPIQVINERDPSSNVYNNNMIDWFNYHSFLQKFICSCAEKAFKKGYKVIGIQFYAECYSGPEAHLNYKKHGSSVQCQDTSYEFCKKNANVCTGKDATNYMYRIAPTDCDLNYEPVGCYSDKNTPPRPLPEYIMNERDYSISNWNGLMIDWKNWDTYSPKLICRCAKKAKEMGYKTFGLQFYGECWSGSEDKVNATKDGETATCLAAQFDPCPYNSYHCIGKEYTNRVYQLN